MDNCLFCKIIKKELPAYTVYEDSNTIAFLDINPLQPGHTLIVPKKHCADFSQLSQQDGSTLMIIGQKVLNAILKSNLVAQGANMLINQDPVAGQSVLHVHMHIIPRSRKDNLGLNFNHSRQAQIETKEFIEVAKQISENLK